MDQWARGRRKAGRRHMRMVKRKLSLFALYYSMVSTLWHININIQQLYKLPPKIQFVVQRWITGSSACLWRLLYRERKQKLPIVLPLLLHAFSLLLHKWHNRYEIWNVTRPRQVCESASEWWKEEGGRDLSWRDSPWKWPDPDIIKPTAVATDLFQPKIPELSLSERQDLPIVTSREKDSPDRPAWRLLI